MMLSNLSPSNEPVAYATLAPIVVAIAAHYGLKLTTDQVIAAGSLVGILAGLFARNAVTPTAKL